MQPDGLRYVTIVYMDYCPVGCDAIVFVVYAIMACTGAMLCAVLFNDAVRLCSVECLNLRHSPGICLETGHERTL